MEYASTVKFRGERKSVDPANGKYGKPVGWFRTKENPGDGLCITLMLQIKHGLNLNQSLLPGPSGSCLGTITPP